MLRFLVTAASSNSGKTAVTCGLLSLLKQQGYDPCAFKCGPDYIDPMFHRSVLGIESDNLDVFLAGEEGVKSVFARGCQGHDAAVCEGVMGYYDGITNTSVPKSNGQAHAGTASPETGDAAGRTTEETVRADDPPKLFPKASAWHVASLLEIPAILVLRPKGAALTLAAVIKGMDQFRMPSRICGVIFNDCSEMYYRMYGPMIEAESGIPVLGYLPHMEEAIFESRHLGLMTAEEIQDLSACIQRIGARMKETIDLRRLVEVTATAGKVGADDDAGTVIDLTEEFASMDAAGKSCETESAGTVIDPGEEVERVNAADSGRETNASAQPVHIAVAKDAAFNFIYAQTIVALEEAGAVIEYFSPMADQRLHENVSGLYLPGGYPELYGKQLAENESMRESIREAIKSGLPVIAECGGFLYLGESLEDADGKSWPMVGALPGHGAGTGKLVRFGYGHIGSDTDSMLLRAGEQIPVHEFHYWDTTAQGSDLTLTKSSNGKQWAFGYASDTMYAGFPHLYLGGSVPAAGCGAAGDGKVQGEKEESYDHTEPSETLAARFVQAARRYSAKAGDAKCSEHPGKVAKDGSDFNSADWTEA